MVKFGIAALTFVRGGQNAAFFGWGTFTPAEGSIQSNRNCIHFKLIWGGYWWIDSFHLIGIDGKIKNSG